jgi:hypothetical protein
MGSPRWKIPLSPPLEKGGGKGILPLFKRLKCYPEFRILIYINARKKSSSILFPLLNKEKQDE